MKKHDIIEAIEKKFPETGRSLPARAMQRLIIKFIRTLPDDEKELNVKTCDQCKSITDAGSTIFICESCGADGYFPSPPRPVPTLEEIHEAVLNGKRTWFAKSGTDHVELEKHISKAIHKLLGGEGK